MYTYIHTGRQSGRQISTGPGPDKQSNTNESIHINTTTTSATRNTGCTKGTPTKQNRHTGSQPHKYRRPVSKSERLTCAPRNKTIHTYRAPTLEYTHIHTENTNIHWHTYLHTYMQGCKQAHMHIHIVPERQRGIN